MISLSIQINKLKWTKSTAILKVLTDFAIGKILTKFKCVKFIIYLWFRKHLFITNVLTMPSGSHYEIKNT